MQRKFHGRHFPSSLLDDSTLLLDKPIKTCITPGWDEGWTDLKNKVWFEYSWEDVPIEVKTEGAIGSNEIISFEVQSSNDNGIARIDVVLDENPHYFVQYCQEEKNLENLPQDNRRIWTFKKYGFEGVSIECDGVEVGRIMFKESTTPGPCRDSRWNTDKVAEVNFIREEEASKGIRGKK